MLLIGTAFKKAKAYVLDHLGKEALYDEAIADIVIKRLYKMADGAINEQSKNGKIGASSQKTRKIRLALRRWHGWTGTRAFPNEDRLRKAKKEVTDRCEKSGVKASISFYESTGRPVRRLFRWHYEARPPNIQVSFHTLGKN